MLLSRTILILLLAFVAAAPLSANEAIEKRLAEMEPPIHVDSVHRTAIDGIFEVHIETLVFYMSQDGRFLIQGSLTDLDTMENLTEKARRGLRAEIFSEIPDSELTVYEPEGRVRYTLNVFTDPACPYCRQLHKEMDAYLAAGVKVRYLMLPILGRESPSLMVSTWCAASRTDAMDRVKSGIPVTPADCPTPMDEHRALAQQLGITGTPATVTAGGQQISGYRPVVEMLQLLEGE